MNKKCLLCNKDFCTKSNPDGKYCSRDCFHESTKGVLKTEKAKRKMSVGMKGRIPWNKGLTKFTDERLRIYGEKVSKSKKGKPNFKLRGIKRLEETKRKVGESRKHILYTDEWRKNLSIAQKGRKHSPETRKKISIANTGQGHWNWQGGSAVEPYAVGWTNSYKEFIRKRDKYTCQLCSKKYKKEMKSFPVHHIDYNKKNLDTKNLITLCIRCHNRTHFNRVYWYILFKQRNINENLQAVRHPLAC